MEKTRDKNYWREKFEPLPGRPAFEEGRVQGSVEARMEGLRGRVREAWNEIPPGGRRAIEIAAKGAGIIVGATMALEVTTQIVIPQMAAGLEVLRSDPITGAALRGDFGYLADRAVMGTVRTVINEFPALGDGIYRAGRLVVAAIPGLGVNTPAPAEDLAKAALAAAKIGIEEKYVGVFRRGAGGLIGAGLKKGE